MKHFLVLFVFCFSFIFGNQTFSEMMNTRDAAEEDYSLKWDPDLLLAPIEIQIDQLRNREKIVRKGIETINQGKLDRFEEELLSEYKSRLQDGFIFQAILLDYSILSDDFKTFQFVLDHLDVWEGIKEYQTENELIDNWIQGVLQKLMFGVKKFRSDRLREDSLLISAVDLAARGSDQLDHGKLRFAHFLFNLVLLINPENGRAWNGIGTIHELAGELEEAIEFYEKAESYGWSEAIRSQFLLFMRHKRYDDVYRMKPKIKNIFHNDLDVQMLTFGLALERSDREVFQWAYENAALEALNESRTAAEYSIISVGLERFGESKKD